jgi:hypothetical protein
MGHIRFRLGLIAVTALFGFHSAHSEVRPEKVYVADTKKNKNYIRDGLIVGGDKAINQVIVKNIRRSNNASFERIVIDLEANHDGESVAIQRSPYFQLAVTPDERRLVMTIWGQPRLDFDPKKIISAFKKSQSIDTIELLPRLENDSWTFVLNLKNNASVETFELSKPVRVILDIQQKKS